MLWYTLLTSFLSALFLSLSSSKAHFLVFGTETQDSTFLALLSTSSYYSCLRQAMKEKRGKEELQGQGTEGAEHLLAFRRPHGGEEREEQKGKRALPAGHATENTC